MSEYEFEVPGEIIKMIHGELPAVRWTCGKCGDDACTIFYEPAEVERVVTCESCGAINLVSRPSE
jgi:ribosomal protein S27E